MLPIEVIPFSPVHQTAVVDLILPIQQAEFGIPISLEAQKDLLDIPGFYQTRNGNFWIAVHGSEVIGTVALLDIGNDQAALRKMFVKAAFRGRERGVAERLLATLLQWCRARGVCEVLLGTTAQFLAAHRFYEKNGFTDIPQSQLPASFPVMSVDTKFYRHVLAGR
jgi:N-acetylglutamate synthase-like GNAT family acetyltransferase